ncbi:hypothetical protein MIMGU_mgv1a001707mg [Erythranthe guttata]|uniref:SWIM-type domain-containing protein n=3 Tax=Erythranthe guttata TaxID=4155 RepID=A0A022QYK6_ERYGU|nr:PREDICTED: uncharacterized protein LOC105964296 isoform X4 [Erythranthe guttata]EYU31645.1 hypothetical protein MIMGU_mgv1a001707mg [Erythranthe guttata]|eukprot:XP_012844282.1 PREDICTED: uncharacterized protein LOC105964296 isoform X4 [Erythranthe guttata]
MATKKIIAICQSGGEFETNKDDGSLFYTGGEAYALDLDHKTQLKDFKRELAETFQFRAAALSIKYFLPGNRKTLITISKDKDLKRMVNFFKDTDQVEVFVVAEEVDVAAPNVSNMPASRSSRTTVSAAAVPSDVPVDVMQTDDAIVLDEPIETTPLGACSFSNEDRHRRAATQWENIITGVDQRFNTFAEFREALHKYSIAHGFTYKYKKNDSHRVTAKCKTEGCPWRIYASRLATTQLICIKKMNPEHTCEGATVKAGYRATRGWIGNIIKEKLKVSPNYKPKDIASDIKREYGIQLNYTQAWRAKEIAREQLQGSYKEAYSQLPFFCQNIMETNPGSLATFSTKEDSSFRRFFVSFHASISGFHQCRPLLFLDSTLLYSKYQGTLLAATAADGNDDFFPVAFAVVDEETEDNWNWFLTELKSALSTSEQITFVSDFQKGIKNSLIEIFGNECYHGYCLRSLAEKLNKDLKGQFSHDARRLMVQDFYAAAYAPKIEVFERCAENIKAISIEAYDWVIRSEPEHWANAIFGGARYNHMTSNFGQQFYGWVSEVDELPITQMVDVLRGKIMELIYRRRLESSQWVTRLTPFMEDKLQLEMSKSRSFQVALAHTSTFEVRGGESVDIVDIDHWDCSCKGWQLSGLPCCHAIAVILCLGRSLYEYCSRFFMTESYRLTYTESINPIPNVEKPERSELHEATIVTPPPTKRPPGRPKLKSAESADVIKRQLQCSKCKGLGHNKKTCYRVNGVGVEEPETPILTVLGTEEPEGSS